MGSDNPTLRTADGPVSAPSSPGTPDERSPTVLLAIDRTPNRTQLREWLSARFAVITVRDVGFEEGLDRCDVCLLDAASFERYRDRLETGKDEAEPVFLPYLLALPEGDPGDLDADTWSAVDDVVATPIARTELRARLEVLLRARQYSVDLKVQNDRLARFADIVSHDLRNPLNIADGFLDLARATGDAEHFDRVDRALDRMAEITEGLLDLARKGVVAEETEPLGVAAIAKTAWDTVGTKQATLELQIPEAARVRADEGRAVEVFENLFRNAVEHAGDDGTVRIGSLDGATGFYVEDDGPGIPEADRSAVFEYGFTTREDGTGLGLAIVQGIVGAHDWSIEVTDGPEGGARFEIYCDFAVPPSADEPAATHELDPD